MSGAVARPERFAARARRSHRRAPAGTRAARARVRPGSPRRCRARASPSTTAMARSLTSAGFCRPSSMMTALTLRPLSSIILTPSSRSRATSVGATRASSSGSSPKRHAALAPSSTHTGPALVPAVAARQEHRRAAARDEQLRDEDGERRLAGAAGGEVADADDGIARAVGLPPAKARARPWHRRVATSGASRRARARRPSRAAPYHQPGSSRRTLQSLVGQIAEKRRDRLLQRARQRGERLRRARAHARHLRGLFNRWVTAAARLLAPSTSMAPWWRRSVR